MKNYLYLISGALLFSVSVAWVASPAGLVSGGVSGIGIVIKEITGVVPIALTSFVLNVPLFLISFFQRGFRFIAKSLFAFLLLTVLLAVFEAMPSPFSFGEDFLAAALVFGALSGVGLGFVLRAGATSGGTDMLAAIIKKKNPHLKMSQIILGVDVAVILLGIFLFGVRKGIYATLALIVATKIIDGVVNGFSTSKAVFILSDKDAEISRFIMDTLERGVTGIDARGLFTGSSKTLLFSVVSRGELAKIRKTVGEIDTDAFIFVTDAVEVLGKGFGNLVPSKDFLG